MPGHICHISVGNSRFPGVYILIHACMFNVHMDVIIVYSFKLVSIGTLYDRWGRDPTGVLNRIKGAYFPFNTRYPCISTNNGKVNKHERGRLGS